MLIPPNKRIYVEKGWGGEDWIYNGDIYCGKRLYFNRKKQCSFHYHKIKDEVLLLERGLIVFSYGYEEDINKSTQIILHPDDAFHVPPGLIHRMYALEESMIFEVSTHHEDDDSIKVIKGD